MSSGRINNFISLVAARSVLFLWLATGAIIIITFLAVYYKVHSAPHTIALHYNVIIGVDVLGSRLKLYQIPLTAVAIAAFNVILLRLLRLRQQFFAIMLAAVSLLCAVILLAAVLFLYSVN